jgi:hypothetical protein
LASAAEAQSPSPPPAPAFAHTVALTTGLTYTDRLDVTASPRPYSGVGTAATVRYRFEPGRWSVAVEGGGSRSAYEPQDDFAGSEHSIGGSLGLTVERQTTTIRGLSLRLGLHLDTRAELLEHRYADVASTLSSFVTAFGTLGPTATVQRPLGDGSISATAIVPVVGLAHQPYANTRQEREPVSVQTVDVSALRGASLGLRYESSTSARMGIVAEYHLRTFDYLGRWRTRSFSNATAVGVVARFGSTR